MQYDIVPSYVLNYDSDYWFLATVEAMFETT